MRLANQEQEDNEVKHVFERTLARSQAAPVRQYGAESGDEENVQPARAAAGKRKGPVPIRDG